MAILEATVKDAVKRVLKQYNCFQHWPVQTGYGAPILDCIGCYNGLYFAIETKAPGKHPTPRQELTMSDINAARGAVFVIGEKAFFDKRTGKVATYSGLRELETWLEMNR